MSYIINKTNGNVLVTQGMNSGTLLDGTVDSNTGLNLIGRNYPNYGEKQNENFVRLLENFAGSVPPTVSLSALNTLTGTTWYDTSAGILKVYDGANWNSVSGTTGEDIAILRADTGTYITSNVATLVDTIAQLRADFSANIPIINSNLDSVNNAFTANAASQQIQIDSLINLTNISNANAASQQTQINSLVAGGYSNANVASYLSTNGGKITAPTQFFNSNTTDVATTAFVQTVFPRGMIMMWNSTAASIPQGFQLCDGSNGTPDLRGQFVVGAGGTYTPGNTGGSGTVTLSISNLPGHTHSFTGSGVTGAGGAHSHTASTAVSDTGHIHIVTDPGHYHIMPGDDQLAFANGYGGWTATSAAGFPYDAISNHGGGGQLWRTTSSTTGITIAAGQANLVGSTTVSTASDHTHTVSVTGTTQSTGTGSAINTLPPYYALCYIQKMF
jgi:hypothetical protein